MQLYLATCRLGHMDGDYGIKVAKHDALGIGSNTSTSTGNRSHKDPRVHWVVVRYKETAQTFLKRLF